MRSKGFIFSLDAFVAFTLSLVAIYSLIFFSSIPSAHYSVIMQAHLIAKDALFSLSSTPCNPSVYAECEEDTTILNFVVIRRADNPDPRFIEEFIGSAIPEQYGFSLSLYDDNTNTWKEIGKRDRPQKILSVSEYTIASDFIAEVDEPENPYKYQTCNGDPGINIACGQPISSYRTQLLANNFAIKLVRLTVFI